MGLLRCARTDCRQRRRATHPSHVRGGPEPVFPGDLPGSRAPEFSDVRLPPFRIEFIQRPKQRREFVAYFFVGLCRACSEGRLRLLQDRFGTRLRFRRRELSGQFWNFRGSRFSEIPVHIYVLCSGPKRSRALSTCREALHLRSRRSAFDIQARRRDESLHRRRIS